MELILSPNDNLNKIRLRSVETFCVEGPTLCVIFKDGRTRNYPMEHLWYYQSDVSNHSVDKTYKSSELVGNSAKVVGNGI